MIIIGGVDWTKIGRGRMAAKRREEHTVAGEEILSSMRAGESKAGAALGVLESRLLRLSLDEFLPPEKMGVGGWTISGTFNDDDDD